MITNKTINLRVIHGLCNLAHIRVTLSPWDTVQKKEQQLLNKNYLDNRRKFILYRFQQGCLFRDCIANN